MTGHDASRSEMDSPPPRVTYGKLPDQPFEVSYGQTSLSAKHQEISTPRRKTRISKGSRTWKRPRLESKENVDSASIPECTPASDLNDIDCENEDNQGAHQAWEIDKDVLPQTSDITYTGFIGAVMSDECSFYQLTQKIFVANGWNHLKNETNVRVLLLQLRFA